MTTTFETPVVPAPAAPARTVHTGRRLGMVVAGRLAAGYAAFFTIGSVGSEVVDLLQGDPYVYIGNALVMGVAALVVGGIPALFIGAVGGGIIGWVIRQLHQPLPFKGAFTVGVGVGIVLLFVPNILVARTFLEALRSAYVVDWPAFVVVWYLPCLFALSGLGWVAHRLNLLIADSSPGPYP